MIPDLTTFFKLSNLFAQKLMIQELNSRIILRCLKRHRSWNPMDCSKVKGYNGSIKGKVLGSDAMWVTVPSRLAVLGHHPDCITTKF